MDLDEWEESPTYYELVYAIREFLISRFNGTEKQSSAPVDGVWSYKFTFVDVLLVIIAAITWTILRQYVTEKYLKPLGAYFALTPSNQKKMPESGWKFLYYISVFSFNFYILVLSGDYKFLQKPSTVWNGWNLNESPPNNMYIFYIAQCGFYLHSLYASVFMDTWKSDSLIMLIHHTSALTLISLSFVLRCHNIGCFVLLLHDVCDIFLESSKLNVYFKVQNNETVRLHEILANISFACFVITWYIARLYWYPLRVVYTGISNVNGLQSVLPCTLVMNGLLWVLQLINIYWFCLILQTLYRILTGQMAEDAREYDVQEKLNDKISRMKKKQY